jgi:hypothetical protein
MHFRIAVVDRDGKAKKFFEKYAMVQEEVKLALFPIYKQANDEISALATDVNHALTAPLSRQQRDTEIQRYADGVRTILDREMTRASDAALEIITKHAQADKDFSKYRFEMVKEVGVGAGTIAVHAAGLAASAGTFGATSVLHILGIIKGSIKIFKAMSDVLKSTDKILEELQKELGKLKIDKNSFKPETVKSKLKTAGKVTANAFLETMLGVTIFASFKEAGRKALIARGKIGYKLVKADKLRNELEDMLDTVERLQALRKSPEATGQQILEITFRKLPKLEQGIDARIKAIIHYHERYEATKLYFDTLESVLNELEAKNKAQKAAEEWLPLILGLLTIPLTLADASALEELGTKAMEGLVDVAKDLGIEKGADAVGVAYDKVLNN